MLQYIVKRLLGLLPTLLIVGLLVFLFVHLLPGDPARLAAGPDATPETVELVRKDLGLDRPLPQQFVRFVAGVVHWDFGKSLRTKRARRDRDRRPLHADVLAHRLEHGVVGAVRDDHRHRVGGLAQPLAGPRSA